MKNSKYVTILTDIVLVLVVCAVVIVGTAGSTVNVFKQSDYPPVYHGNTLTKNISLMFNVYWGTEYLDSILKTLKKYNVNATFFVGGFWAMQNEDTLCRIVNEGHEIGNHGYFHKNHAELSYEDNLAEIVNCGKLVFELTGQQMNLFAPPSGYYSAKTLQSAHDAGYKTIMWSRDTVDWRDKDTNVIFKRATENVCGGDLVLMHPTKQTAEVLPEIIEFLQKMGYNIVTVTKNMDGIE